MLLGGVIGAITPPQPLFRCVWQPEHTICESEMLGIRRVQRGLKRGQSANNLRCTPHVTLTIPLAQIQIRILCSHGKHHQQHDVARTETRLSHGDSVIYRN